MHEIGIVQSVLEAAVQSAQTSGANRIHQVRLRVGTMTGVVPEALQFAFEALREGTMASSATLEIETVPAVSWCGECQVEFSSEDWRYECPKCRRPSSELRHGSELELASMEVS